MKNTIQFTLLLCLIFFVQGCEKENETETTENTTSNTSTATATDIGAEYQGGIIFYHFKNGDPGYVSGETHGLIVSSEDVGNSSQWGCSSYEFGNLSTAIGGGKNNTSLVASTCQAAGIATKICEDYEKEGYTDWYLPSRDELYAIYNNLSPSNIGNFSNFNYWSSSESGSYNTVEVMVLSSGYKGNQWKNNVCKCRPIRAF